MKSSFEHNPVMQGNMRTTNFKNCSPRKAHDVQYMPGNKSPRANEYVPGPGTYIYKNMAIAHNDNQKFTLKPRTNIINGKQSLLMFLIDKAP